MNTTDARKLNQETQHELRKQVIRLREKGHDNATIAEIVGLCPSHISTIWQKYKRGGWEAIKPGVRGRRHGEQRELSADQEAAIQKLLVDKTPDQLKLAFALWTREAVRLAIKQVANQDLPLRTINDYLKRWGFTPQKPTKRAYEQNPKAVEQWHEVNHRGTLLSIYLL
jgi:transposase